MYKTETYGGRVVDDLDPVSYTSDGRVAKRSHVSGRFGTSKDAQDFISRLVAHITHSLKAEAKFMIDTCTVLITIIQK